MKLKKPFYLLVGSITVSLAIGIIIGNFIITFLVKKGLFVNSYSNKINTILDIISNKYIDNISMKDAIENSVLHIVNELDPYSTYVSNEKVKQFNEDISGHFGGIGINCFSYKDTIVIINVLQGSPASQVGLLAGDRIIYVNDSIFIGNDIMWEKTSKGGIGTLLKLGICRNYSNQIINFYVKRKNILIPTVKSAYEIEKGIGFIKIYDKFTYHTYQEFICAVKKLLSLGCTSFLIDLRMNKGGSYESAIKIANEFLPINNTIVYTEGKSVSRIKSISNGTGVLQNSQIVILIDEMSASASEIIAGAIQDNDRGLIIGQESFGKSLIQNQIKLSDGSILILSIAQYYTPSGRNIQRKYKLGKMINHNVMWIGTYENKNDEYYDKNSTKVDTTMFYYTLHGRVVYGGCGIIPDILVPVNTLHFFSYYLNLEKKNIFNQFAFEYSDKNRKKLEQFKDYLSMLKYLKTQPILEYIVEYASNNGIKKKTFLIDYSANKILNTAYAWILKIFFGDNAFYPVYLNNDPVIVQAIEAINNRYACPESILVMNYKN